MEKETMDGLPRLLGREGGPTMAVPPPPPPKDELPPLPRSAPSVPIGSPSEPPNRPLPSRPSTRSSERAPRKPLPTRAPTLRPQAPLAMNPPTRPGTAATQTSGAATPVTLPGSTKRLSWTSMGSKRPLKYAQGKYGRVELVPQPSDDPDDPLNWPMWRKELNFWSLMLMGAMTGVAKTIFMTVNAQLAESYDISYTSVAALTGVPLILSAFTGLVCLAASRICGKRPLYLVSLVLVFIGTVWNTNVASSYSQCMAARVFQGLGWGAFDVLILGSIQDTYFDHERSRRVATYSIIAVTTTWGPPLLGGVASQGQKGFSLQFSILSAFFVVAVPAIALGSPETAFDRTFAIAQTPATAASTFKTSFPPRPRRLLSLETVTEYVVKLKPYGYRGPATLYILLQAPRAFITPTTLLLFVVSFLPSSSFWGLASSLSLFFEPLPFMLSSFSIGALFVGPFLLATAAVAIPCYLPRWQQHARFTARTHISVLAGAAALIFTGLLAFGLHLDHAMTPQTPQPDSETAAISPFAQDYLPARVSLPAVSFTLGLLAAGTSLLASTALPLIAASTAFTAPSLQVATRDTADMAAGVACWRALAAGVFVIGIPNAVWWWDGLKGFCVAVGTVQVVVVAVVGMVWWFGSGVVRRLDGRVMGLVDLEGLRGGKGGSFFDLD